MHRPTTAAEVLALVEEQNVQFVRLQFTDVLGQVKNVDVPARQLPKALDGQILFDGSAIEGFVRIEESDMLLLPDPQTFAIFPWEEHGRTARLICDIMHPDGTPFAGDPRGALKRVMAEAADLDYTLMVGPELEFFLFELDPDGKPTTKTSDTASYFDLGPLDRGEACRREIVVTLQAMGFEIEASHHEVAPGQHEIDFKYADAVTTADNISTFRYVARTVALKHGLWASFMPKPVFGVSGSGLHLHQSFFKNGENAFYDPNAPEGLSPLALHYIAGLLEHAPAYTAITNPLVNSYKRLVPGYEAPVYIAWSLENRSPLIRVPARRGRSTRVELRSPDPACNPYLALAVTLAAGLDGVRRGLTPPSPVDRNLYAMSREEREEEAIEVLPHNLNAALDQLQRSVVVQEALGDHLLLAFLEAKRIEWDIYRSQVHGWELDQYLALI